MSVKVKYGNDVHTITKVDRSLVEYRINGEYIGIVTMSDILKLVTSKCQGINEHCME